MDPTYVFNFFTFFERILYKSNCIIFIFCWCATHTKIRSKLVVIVKAGSQKITLWGPQRTPLDILRVKVTNAPQHPFQEFSKYFVSLMKPKGLLPRSLGQLVSVPHKIQLHSTHVSASCPSTFRFNYIMQFIPLCLKLLLPFVTLTKILTRVFMPLSSPPPSYLHSGPFHRWGTE